METAIKLSGKHSVLVCLYTIISLCFSSTTFGQAGMLDTSFNKDDKGWGRGDESFRKYFDWLLQMHDDPEYRPELEEVRELANQCPEVYGSVVYSVRNLYNALTERINEFDGKCEGESESSKGFTRLKQPKKPSDENTEARITKIYPNPASSSVFISGSGIRKVTIVDILGRGQVSQLFGGTALAQIDISRLPRGIYLVTVVSRDGRTETEKLIIE